jgi:DNA-binding NtrC family response regulator
MVLSAAALTALHAYDWPGNVRELERTLEGAVTAARSNVIDVDDLAAAVRHPFADVIAPSLVRDDSMRAWGARYAQVVLERCGRNKRQACRVLGISYHTLQAYLNTRPDGGDGASDVGSETPKGARAPGAPVVSPGNRFEGTAEAHGL